MHKTMTTLGKVFDRVEEMSKECKDRNVKVKDISFESLEVMRIGSERHKLREIAQRSICWRLGVPWHYLEKCPADLQRENMAYWIKEEKNDELFFRFDGTDVRAIFTPKYKPVDNFEVLERLDSLGYGPDTEVQVHLDHEYMAISIPDGKKSFMVSKGDKITPGVSVSNSEVGLASLSVAAFFLRLSCTNGSIMRTEVSASYRHVSYKILTELPQVLDKISIELGAQKDKFRISIETKVEHPELTMASFNRQFMLGTLEKEAVEWGFAQEPGNSMFSIVNAYTRAAQFEGLSAESSHRLQRTGGAILSMLKAK